MQRVPCRTALALLILVLTAAASYGNVPGGGTAAGAVTFTRANGAATLSNGIITAVIQTANARVISMTYRGRQMIQTGPGKKDIYFSMDGGKNYEQPSHCVFSVTRQSPGHIDISCTHIYTPALHDIHPWDIDVHFVLRSGARGLYVYAILNHPASYPTMRMGEWRMVWWMPIANGQFVMERLYVDALRHGLMPSVSDLAHAQPTPIKESVRVTTGPFAGQYDCKYAYSAEYGSLGAYGHASNINHVGAWVVLGGHEYFNDGPTKQDLTSASGIIHLHLYENHYGAPGFTIPHGQSWRKVYGPWLLYCNSETTGDRAWADAETQASAEQAAWPYAWMPTRDTPSERVRGTVSGRLIVHDPLKPAVSGAGAWVGLALPEQTAGSWQFQGAGYQFWVHAAADGSFRIPHVRPGVYELYAFTRGAVGEFTGQRVVVRTGRTTALGLLVWNVPHHGRRIAWEIGVPDRSSDEFRHGNDYFKPYLYKQFSGEFPNPLAYDAAKQNWATAWNYAQSAYVADGVRSPWKWRIHFSLDRVPAGAATLTLAFAGSNRARLNVYVNDETTPFTSFSPPNQGGNALLRESDHAKYGVTYVSIPADRLRTGGNIIALEEVSITNDASHVMYDYLSLELP